MDFAWGGGGGGMPLDPARFQCFSFEAIHVPDMKIGHDLYDIGSMRLGSNMRVGNMHLVA